VEKGGRVFRTEKTNSTLVCGVSSQYRKREYAKDTRNGPIKQEVGGQSGAMVLGEMQEGKFGFVSVGGGLADKKKIGNLSSPSLIAAEPAIVQRREEEERRRKGCRVFAGISTQIRNRQDDFSGRKKKSRP